VSISDFQARCDQAFWKRTQAQVEEWDTLIDEFNARAGVLESL
jgi:hypothetical protein